MTTTPAVQQPTVVDRELRPFVGITRTLTMATLNEAADEIPGLIGWLGEHGGAPAGPPFVRFLVIDMAGDMVVQAGFPVAAPVEGDGDVEAGTLPGGRYVTVLHTGHYDGLYGATRDLLRWAGEQGLSFDKHPTDAGEAWGSRLEWYLNDPSASPDPATWVTRLEFRLAE